MFAVNQQDPNEHNHNRYPDNGADPFALNDAPSTEYSKLQRHLSSVAHVMRHVIPPRDVYATTWAGTWKWKQTIDILSFQQISLSRVNF